MDRLPMAAPKACPSIGESGKPCCAYACELPCPVCCSAGGNHPRLGALPPVPTYPSPCPIRFGPCMAGWW